MEEEKKEEAPKKKTKEYTEGMAIRVIQASRGVICDSGPIIKVVSGSLGLKRLGALDYLVNFCKRRVIWCSKLPERS